jgi:hypothetical protein
MLTPFVNARVRINAPFTDFHDMFGTVVKVMEVKWDDDTKAANPGVQLPKVLYVVYVDGYGFINKENESPIAYPAGNLIVIPTAPEYKKPEVTSWRRFDLIMSKLGEQDLANNITKRIV